VSSSGPNLFAEILDMILEKLCARFIGPKSVILSGQLFLGTRTMNA
jgi:hypothetical protein